MMNVSYIFVQTDSSALEFFKTAYVLLQRYKQMIKAKFHNAQQSNSLNQLNMHFFN